MARRKIKPYVWTEDLEDELLWRFSEGAPIDKICKMKHMPSISQLWSKRINDLAFAAKFREAKHCWADGAAFEALKEAMNREGDLGRFGSSAVARSKTIVDMYKWMCGKYLPEEYGDKVNVAHSGGVTQKRVVVVENFDGVSIDKRPRITGN
jgi:hypothetical protein